ncbi:hypothetical protein VM1G_11009 [Cytospora mali]|uniref:Uncharacterized protein n=1 Tax=Cytospora mali TaxID=578113 RepID=A0A194VJM9_CYTMA|nr:hypothetical protein VM1G_11009 [Valsa mali]
MWAKYMSSLLMVACVAGKDLRARHPNTTTIASRVQDGIQTECKTCPYELCTNHAAYYYNEYMTLTCWTYGDNIVDSNIWLKTTDGCYVTQWDIEEYMGDYTDTPGFPYCGYIHEKITTGPSETVYNTECNIIPEFVEPDDHIKMYQPDVNLTLTCYTDDGHDVLGNPIWYKTTSNCYVPDLQIGSVDATLDYCGPIPFMEKSMRQPDPEPSTTAVAAFAARAEDIPHKRWLYATTIADLYSNCYSDPISDSKVERVYSHGDQIVVQCATYGVAPEDSQIYLLTEYFCWVNNTLTSPQLVDNELRAERYPNCNLFIDTTG